MDQQDNWQHLQTIDHKNFGILSVEIVRKRWPASGVEQDFVHINTSDWVCVIAEADDDHLVMIEQYRHGAGSVLIDLPGGLVDAGEDPKQAALRELQEETGYGAEQIICLGKLNPNPAIFKNACHIFLAKNAQKVFEQALDDTEKIRVKLLPKKEVFKLITSGNLQHGLVVAAFCLYQNYLSEA